jgi:hypothetical protein
MICGLSAASRERDKYVRFMIDDKDASAAAPTICALTSFFSLNAGL